MTIHPLPAAAKSTLRILAIAALVMLTVSPANAQLEPAWLEDVTAQALIELDCEVAYFMSNSEEELGGRLMQEARMQCADGRQFDAVRVSPAEEFTFKTCDTQVC
jgi:hypothetical protein